MKYHITHINLAFTLGMSFTALSRSAASCHHWLGCFICPRIPRETSRSLFIWGSIWQTGAFFFLFFFFLQFSGHSETTTGKIRVMHWYHKETKSPFLLFWPKLQRRLQLHHSHKVLWCWAAQYTASSALSFLADMEDHGTRQAEEGSQILVPQSTSSTGRAGVGVPFHSSASGVTSEGNKLQSLPQPGEDGNSTCPNAFTLSLPKIPRMIQAKLSRERSSLVVQNCSPYTLVAIGARAAFVG